MKKSPHVWLKEVEADKGRAFRIVQLQNTVDYTIGDVLTLAEVKSLCGKEAAYIVTLS